MADLTDEAKKHSAQILKKYLIGGAALGGGVGLLTSLVNYINHLKDEKEDSSVDDDTIYVYKDPEMVDQTKSANWIDTGVGIAGGAAAALGMYSLVNKLYSEFRRKEAQEALDKAQHVFLNAQGYKDVKDKKKKKKEDSDSTKEELQKSAADEEGGRAASGLENLFAAPVAVPLLLALASGVVTNEVLKSKYPNQKPKIKPPKRFEVVSAPEDEDDEEEGKDEFKAAAFQEELEDDAAEFMLRMTLENPCRNSDLTNIVKNAAMGGHLGFKDTVNTIGLTNALSMVKGASVQTPDPLAEHLAVCWLNKSARLKHGIRLVAAGEFVEKYPELYKQACNLSEHERAWLYKIAGIMGVAVRAERSQELGITADKEALQVKTAAGGSSEVEPILEELISEINKKKDDSDDQPEDSQLNAEPATEGDEFESSGTSGEEAGISDPDSPSRPTEAQKLQFVRAGKTMRRFSKDDATDLIDKILSAK